MIPQARIGLVAAKVGLVVLILLFVETRPVTAQVQTGTPKYESFGGGPFDTVNLGDLNVHFVIPVLHKPGRGMPFGFDITYDSTFWQPTPVNGVLNWQPSPTSGFGGTALDLGALTYLYIIFPSCTYNGSVYYNCLEDYDFAYTDGFGTMHSFSGSAWCLPNGPDLPLQQTAFDNTGYTLSWDACSGAFSLFASDGSLLVPAGTLFGSGSPASVVDRNGNMISESSSATFTDTLGTQVLTQSGGNPTQTGGAPYVATYTDPNGHAASVTLSWTSYTVQTNFSCSGITDYPATSGYYLPNRITLPNGTFYQFSYEATPGHPGNVTGRLASVILPTGGTIHYTYTGANNGINCADGSAMGLTRQTPDGTWTYARTLGTQGITTTTITDPSSNQSVIQFASGLGLFYEQQRKVYQGSSSSGTLLETVTTCYDGNTTNCAGANITIPLSQRAITTQLGTSTSEHVYSYDVYGNPTEVDDYDWGTGAVGALLKKTLYTYASLDKIKSFSQTVTVQNGSGTQIAKTTDNYDGSALQPTSGVPQHTNPPGGSRGNLTSTVRWLNTTGGNVTSSSVFYDTGVVYTMTDPNNNKTTYTYSSTFGSAYLTQVSNPLSQLTKYNYDANTGVRTSSTDANNQVTSYTYDNMLRPIQTNYPDGGQTTMCYTDSGGTGCTKSAAPFSVVTTKKLSSSANMVTTVASDTQGRTVQTQVNSDPAGVDYADTAYDSLGRVYTVSNPHRSSSSTTDGTTTHKYDAMNRTIEVDDPDGSKITTAYSGNCNTVTDEASKVRKSCADGLGRITTLWEDPSGLNYQTSYTYDALNNLLSVTENNSRQRSFVYDSLSRMTSSTNPESGTICYGTYSGSTCQQNGYDANGNLITRIAAAPNQTGSGTVTTTNAYDVLNRITSKTYSNGTPGVYYYYDQTSWGVPLSNTVGRVSSVGTFDGTCFLTASGFSYDTMGRLNLEIDSFLPTETSGCPGAIVTNTSTSYDLAGNQTSLTYPSGRVIKNQFDGASNLTNINVDDLNGYNYLTSATYAPTGAPTSLTLGSGAVESECYNKRLQPGNIQVASGSSTWMNLTYNYYTSGSGGCQSALTGNNGTIMGITDSINTNRTQSFTYDSLNRLSTAQSAATSGADCWGQSFGYDAWGNLLAENVTKCSGTQLSVGVNAQNQITNTGFQYDAAGDLLNDGANTYVYDAEDRVSSANSSAAKYTYDFKGRRVAKKVGSTTTEYVYFNGGALAEYSLGDLVWNDYIFADGRRLAAAGMDDIFNPGFEQGLEGWITWAANNTGSEQVVTDPTRAHSGNKYLQLSTTTAQVLTKNQAIAVNPGDQLTFGGWVYLEPGSATGGSVGWNISVQDANGNVLAYDGAANVSAGSWTYQSVNYTVPTGGASVLLYAQIINPTGLTTARFDDAFLTGPSGLGVHYYHADHLGSARLLTDKTGNLTWSATYLPFGQEWNAQTTTNHYKFTGYERDAETANDYAQARFYSPRLGRFLTPDPAGNASTCPFSPQTQNRYVYVTDDPVNRTDPTGLCGDGDNSDCGGIGITFPLLPTGGGNEQPAPPTPHPIFTFELPPFSNTEQQDPRKPLPFGTTRGSCIRDTKSPEKHGLLGIFKQSECEYTCTFDGPGAPYSADLSTNWTRWGTLGAAVKKQYGKYPKYCPMTFQADFDYQVYDIGGSYYTIYSIEQITNSSDGQN